MTEKVIQDSDSGVGIQPILDVVTIENINPVSQLSNSILARVNSIQESTTLDPEVAEQVSSLLIKIAQRIDVLQQDSVQDAYIVENIIRALHTSMVENAVVAYQTIVALLAILQTSAQSQKGTELEKNLLEALDEAVTDNLAFALEGKLDIAGETNLAIIKVLTSSYKYPVGDELDGAISRNNIQRVRSQLAFIESVVFGKHEDSNSISVFNQLSALGTYSWAIRYLDKDQLPLTADNTKGSKSKGIGLYPRSINVPMACRIILTEICEKMFISGEYEAADIANVWNVINNILLCEEMAFSNFRDFERLAVFAALLDPDMLDEMVGYLEAELDGNRHNPMTQEILDTVDGEFWDVVRAKVYIAKMESWIMSNQDKITDHRDVFKEFNPEKIFNAIRAIPERARKRYVKKIILLDNLSGLLDFMNLAARSIRSYTEEMSPTPTNPSSEVVIKDENGDVIDFDEILANVG